MGKCCIKGCSSNSRKSKKGLSLFRFPKNEKLRKQWIDSIGLESIRCVEIKDKRICSKHFEDDCINKTLDVIRLKDNVVPTLFPTRDAVQCSESKIAKDLNLNKEVQSTSKKKVPVRKQMRRVIIETLTSTEKEKRENIMELSKCYKIIANVYHYLTTEYQFMKKHVGDKCDLGPLANTLKRTADATGVSEVAVRIVLKTEQLKSSIGLEHNYSLSDKSQDDKYDAEEMSPPKRRKIRKNLEHKKQNDQSDAKVEPQKGKTTRNSIKCIPTDEEEMPFPKPIQLKAPQGIEMEIKEEPADDESELMLERDPLEIVSRNYLQCRTPDGTETEFKPEVDDDECLQKLEADPLDTGSRPEALEEHSDTLDFEVKSEYEDLEVLDTEYWSDPDVQDLGSEASSE